MVLASLICSGAMYRGVPMIMPLCVRFLSCLATRDSPKSTIFTRGLPVAGRKMLSGFRSRWITPTS